MGKGINKGIIFKTAEALLKKHGLERLSLRDVAAALDIKPASLYNHINGINDIHEHLAVVASKKVKSKLLKAIEGKNKEEAFVAACYTYEQFADKQRELYKVLINARSSSNKVVREVGMDAFSPIRELIASFGTSEENRLHFTRILRAYLHGFIENSYNGFMRKNEIPKEETFAIGIEQFLKVLRGLENE